MSTLTNEQADVNVNKRTRRFYDIISRVYPLIDICLKPQKRKLFKYINELPAGDLLEIGVGTGAQLDLYKKHQVTAIDNSEGMLMIARRRSLKHIELKQMDGEALLFADHSFDYIVLSHVIAVTGDPERMLQESFRVLKHGGKLIILNHLTPENSLKYVDVLFSRVASMLKFRSVFRLNDLATLKEFHLLEEISPGRLSYFRLIIFLKV